MTDDQLNAAAAKCMGWTLFCADLVPDDEGLFRTDSGDVISVVFDYTPASNLTQAWEFARAMGIKFEMTAWRVFVSGGYTKECDGTPQGAARALTICVLRANGVEA